MDIRWVEEAEEEFLELPENVRREIRSYIEKLPEKGIGWQKVGKLEDKSLGLKVFRLKLMPEDGELNHRVIFDIKDQKYIIYKVGAREGFYSDENLRQVERRI